MRLTTKMRYGTRAMLDLAINGASGPVTIKDIAARQELSSKYLERLLNALQAAGLVRATRGAGGGYQLARPPDAVTLREIYFTLEGPESFVDCTSDAEICHRADGCVTRDVWNEMYAACMQILDSTTLEALARRTEQKQRSCAPAYDI